MRGELPQSGMRVRITRAAAPPFDPEKSRATSRRRQIIGKAEQPGSCLAEVAGRLGAEDLQKGRRDYEIHPEI
jgi:hypothetical protein